MGRENLQFQTNLLILALARQVARQVVRNPKFTFKFTFIEPNLHVRQTLNLQIYSLDLLLPPVEVSLVPPEG